MLSLGVMSPREFDVNRDSPLFSEPINFLPNICCGLSLHGDAQFGEVPIAVIVVAGSLGRNAQFSDQFFTLNPFSFNLCDHHMQN
ncbi:hypothetical protein SY26_19160 [Paracoccus sp. 228]|nr:hypothetical protein SY26_19160 [Paracoccus sp. 228]